LAGTNHCHLVLVKAVSAGGVGPVGTVDVQILVNQVDGDGNATPHGTIHGLPYFRLQGGVSAVVIDPVVGDIGMAVFADRDISSAKINKAPSNPGSSRRFDFSDGLYVGGFLGATPTQYVQFLPGGAGINVVSPMAVTITAPTITANASTTFVVNAPVIALNGQITGGTTGADAHVLQGSLATTGDMLAGSGGANISQLAHIHAGVTTGGGDTSAPVTGT
jgi:hypothetical protein